MIINSSLVFCLLFLLTAETWEIAVETHDWEFWALVCGLFIVSFTVLAWTLYEAWGSLLHLTRRARSSINLVLVSL